MFDVKQSVEGFLEHNLSEGYEKDLTKFHNYIFSLGLNNVTALTYLQGIRTKDIIDSLRYNIGEKGITSIDTALKYVSCVKEYLSYLLHKGYIVNSELIKEFGLPTYSNESFRYKINKFISESGLKERKDFIALSKNEIQSLISDCNAIINDLRDKAVTSKNIYIKFRAAIIIKLIIFLGIRYEYVHTLEKINIDLKHNTITVNGFTIHLPHRLRDQFEIYEELLLEINPKFDDRKFLFINYDGTKIPHVTSTISWHLKTLTGRMDVNGIIKYSIIEMIRVGINESIIKKLTGVDKAIYDPCQDYVNSNLSLKTNMYLDSKMRTLDIFDKL